MAEINHSRWDAAAPYIESASFRLPFSLVMFVGGMMAAGGADAIFPPSSA
jgi:hypothetical protein